MSFDAGEYVRSTVIVEATSNHGGDMEIAKKMIREAAACGADYIKFQSWQAQKLKPGDPNFERHQLAQLSDKDHFLLIDECKKNNIKFLTSCFDKDRVDFLATLGMDTIKVPSPEFTSLKMIERLAVKFDTLILSTGATFTKEIDEVMQVLKGKKFALLHCVSVYPTPLERSNLARMNWLKRYTPYVGFSDHSMGSEVAQMAIAMGARFIEKHFTIDRSLPGRDQAMSALPGDIREITSFRDRFWAAYGQESYEMPPEEKEFRSKYIGKWGDNRT